MPDTAALAGEPNPQPDRDYRVEHATEEFTFLYPVTGQACFGRIEISYTPDGSCLETMALKRYLNSFRNERYYYEAVTNRVLDDVQTACNPRDLSVTIRFNVRGGIETTVTGGVQ